MSDFNEQMQKFKGLLEQGEIQAAYQGLMKYFMGLRTHIKKKYPEYSVSGGIYSGVMDMTYFACTPKAIKDRKLKIALVFLYDTFSFEVWLSGYNKTVHAQYWELIRDSGWDKYKLVAPAAGVDSVLEHVLVENPDFSDLDALTIQIEEGMLAFIGEVENFLAGLKP